MTHRLLVRVVGWARNGHSGRMYKIYSGHLKSASTANIFRPNQDFYVIGNAVTYHVKILDWPKTVEC